jgi:RHS repeat-associated protein
MSIFAYDGDNIIEEVNASGSVVARYMQGQNIDEPLAMSRSSATSYYEADGLGSITSLTNSVSALAQTYTYDAFGKSTASSGSLTNPFQYTAREFDSETNIYYYRARYYDTSAGRFLSEDPLRYEQGMNFYTYVHGNPTTFADPTGLFGWGDFFKALGHYCDGSGTPWTASFSSINWGSLQSDEIAKVRSMVGGSCDERTVPLSFKMPANAAGADSKIIGRHTVLVQGELHVNCDCTWDFIGDMSSAQGWDTYKAYPSNRGIAGETETWILGHSCHGTPFRIYLPGAISGAVSGKINGKPTCECKK